MPKDIIAHELVKFSGKTFLETKQAYEYIGDMLARVYEAGRTDIKEEVEKMTTKCPERESDEFDKGYAKAVEDFNLNISKYFEV